MLSRFSTEILIRPPFNASPLPSCTAKASAANSFLRELIVSKRFNTLSRGAQKVCVNSIRPTITGIGEVDEKVNPNDVNSAGVL